LLPREGPSPLDEVGVPAQERAWCDEQVPATLVGKESGQCADDGSIGPRGARARDLSTHDGELVAQQQDLGVFGCVRTHE
jgi:hypothetical protein